MSRNDKASEIAADLERRIRSGEFAPHERIPTVAALAAQYAIAQNTAHAAVKALARRGLVTSVRSYGTVVRDWRRPRQVQRRRAVYRDEQGFYFDPLAKDWRAVAPSHIAWEPAKDYIAELLGIDAGSEVLIRERVSGDETEIAPGRRHITPQQVCTTTVPADIARQLDLGAKDTGPGGVLCRIEAEFGPVTFDEVTYVRFPTEEEAVQLQLGSGDVPILGIAVTLSDSAGRIAACNDYRMDGRRWMISHPLKRTRSAK